MSKRLILTIVIQAQPYHEYALLLMKQYADQVDADLMIITEQHDYYHPGPHWELLHQMKLASEQDRYQDFLFLDADIFINPQAHDIFALPSPSIFPEDCSHWSAPEGEAFFRDWCQTHYQFQDHTARYRYFNAGVIRINLADLKTLVSGFLPPFIECVFEQHYLNYVFKSLSLRVTPLPKTFNYMWPHFEAMDLSRSFIHLAGESHETRLRLTETLRKHWN